MAADDALHQAFVAQMVEAPFLAVALAGSINQGQVAGAGVAAVAGFNEALLQGDGDVLGEADADKAAGGQGVAIADQGHGLAGADHLAAVRGAQRGNHGVGISHWGPLLDFSYEY